MCHRIDGRKGVFFQVIYKKGTKGALLLGRKILLFKNGCAHPATVVGVKSYVVLEDSLGYRITHNRAVRNQPLDICLTLGIAL